jgi:hypothetical protein
MSLLEMAAVLEGKHEEGSLYKHQQDTSSSIPILITSSVNINQSYSKFYTYPYS